MQKFTINKKTLFILLLMISYLFLYSCSKATEKPSTLIRFEGKNDYWSVFTTIPYTEDTDDKYVKVKFKCRLVDHIFPEHDVISFAIGTSIGTSIYSYKKTEGYIKNEHSIDTVERIVRTSDDTFEVLYNFSELFDNDIFYPSKKDKYKHINIQIGTDGESIDLIPVE